MNKKYEKYINKKSDRNKTNKISILPNKFGLSFTNRNYKYKDTNLTLSKRYTNMYRNKKQKNSFTGFYNKKGKMKIVPGMFSYKRSSNSNFSNSVESNNSIEKPNLSIISNKVGSVNSSNKNHSLFPNLKLLLDNAEISSIKTMTNNDNNISNQFHNHSAMYLNKYKINNTINHKQNRSMDFAYAENNTINNTYYNYRFLKYNNIIINNINQPNIKLNSDEARMKPKQEMKLNLSQFINKPKKVKERDKNNNGIIIKNNFLYKSKAENESRRMIIEYLKVLKRADNTLLKNILKYENISEKVLNQQKYINTNLYIYSMNSQNSKFFYVKNNKKLETPLERTYLKNVSKFLKDMNDITKDKVSMVKYLSTPRIMDLIFNEKIYKFIFLLKPNQLSYLKGLESYIFQWVDLKSKTIVGGFDLIKVNSCCVNFKEDKNVLIETYDGEYHREYELITKSSREASIIVRAINYISRLEKCKMYNKKYFNID